MKRVYRALTGGLVLAALIGAALFGAEQANDKPLAFTPCVNGNPAAWICYYN